MFLNILLMVLKKYIRGNVTTPLKIINFQVNRLSDAAMTRKMESRSAENGLDRYRTLESKLDPSNSHFRPDTRTCPWTSIFLTIKAS
jgi:hypothetical protein